MHLARRAIPAAALVAVLAGAAPPAVHADDGARAARAQARATGSRTEQAGPDRAGTARPRVERVSTGSDGTQADGASTDAVISDDGRQVAFLSQSQALGCSPAYRCLQLKDLTTGRTTGVAQGGGSWWAPPVISGDGRYVGHSSGSKLPAPYLHDRVTGQSTRLFPAERPPGTELGEVWSVSRHGTAVAYTVGDRHGDAFTRYLYVRSTATGADELISGADDGPKVNASLSADGSVVAFTTRPSRDEPADPDADPADVFVVNRATGNRTQADQGLGQATLIQLAADARYAVLTARGGTYVADLRAGTTDRVADAPAVAASRDTRRLLLDTPDGPRLLDRRTGRSAPVGPADAEAVPGAVSAGGRAVVFGSAADDLVPDDTNAAADVFVRRFHAGELRR